MLVVEGGIVVNGDGTISFGDFLAEEKIKVRDFEVGGHMYSVKTHNAVTRLEQNDKMLVECVPGASFWNFAIGDNDITCVLKGRGVASLTFELAPETEYAFFVGGKKIGEMKSTISGKISFSADTNEKGVDIKIANV